MAVLQNPGNQTWQYSNLVTAATTTIKTGIGMLHVVTINIQPATASLVVAIFDNTAASGTTIATLTVPTTSTVIPVALIFDVNFATGLTIQTSGSTAINVTVAWN